MQLKLDINHGLRLLARAMVAVVLACAALGTSGTAHAQSACDADLDGNGSVGASDLSVLLASWGCTECQGDINGDSTVNASDLGALLGLWGGTCAPQPTITSIAPNNGPRWGGTELVITGTNLSSVQSVVLGGRAAAVLSATATTLTVVTAAGNAGTVDVTVTAPTGSDTLEGAFTYTATEAPAWATVLQETPDPKVVTDPAVRAAIEATGLPWRVLASGGGLQGEPIELVLVPGGTYQMGATQPAEGTAAPADAPPHAVQLRSFYIGRTEITQGEWKSWMAGANPSAFQGSGYPNADDRPVENVTRSAIDGFLAAAGVRLPTEAEWEFAYRAGTATAYHSSSNNPATLDEWFSANAAAQTQPVGLKPSNGLGLADMAGNVSEVVSDRYAPDYYLTSPLFDPRGPSSGPAVVRGGSWATNVAQFAARVDATAYGRSQRPQSAAGSSVGFRVARDATVEPVALGLAPSVGPESGGQLVTVSGRGLDKVTAVRFACSSAPGSAATIVSKSDLEIRLLTPPGSAGACGLIALDWSNTDGSASGTVSMANAFTYAAQPPVISAVSPASGPVGGGTAITITGTNLLGATAVTVGGLPAANVVVVNATTVTAITPANAPGAKSVTLTTAAGTASLSNAFTYFVPAPTIASILPTSGPAAGGTTIAITGTNLGGTTSVLVGGVAAFNVFVASPTTVIATTPAGSGGAASVSVTTPGGTATLSGAFTYVALPTITSVSPNAGSSGGGTTITITGTNFSAPASVSLGLANATSVTVVNPTTITAVTTGNVPGPMTVTVTTPAGSASLPNGFTGFSSPNLSTVSPNGGPVAGGTAITITGSNFYNGATNATVSIGGVPATSVTVVSPTTITAITPPGTAGPKSVAITTPSGTTTLSSMFTYFAAPTLSSVSPSAGPVGGGTSISISGNNIGGATSVLVGGNAATVTNNSGNSINATVPAGAAGPANITVVTPGGTATLPNAFTYLPAPTVTAVTPSAGPTAGGTTITITGANFSSPATVSLGGTGASSVVVQNANTITAVTSNVGNAPGPRNVVVTTPGGSGTLPNGYTYFLPPAITGVAPNAGPLGGGTTITVTGTNLTGATSVTVGGNPAANISFPNATTLVATTPPGTVGAKSVVVTTPGGTATASNAFTYIPAPTITLVAPGSGPASGGNSVAIAGTNLDSVTSVTIGGSAATFSVQTPTTINATAPAGAVGPAMVVVQSPGGTATAQQPYTYIAAPVFSAITPPSGPSTGGTTITITGTGFAGTSAVTVGGAPASLVSVTPTSVVAVTPPGVVGPANVFVTTPAGAFGLGNGFTYTAPAWATVIQAAPLAGEVFPQSNVDAIVATGLPWLVRDNATGIDMVLIPPGTFNMGCSPATGQGCSSIELPVHAVTITQPFYIGRYEVTQAQWLGRMGSNPSAAQSPSPGTTAAQVPLRPVENVSWNQVHTFLAGSGLRLPTEAEWEYSYRAGTSTAFHGWPSTQNGTNNDAIAVVGEIGWFYWNTSAVGLVPQPVGRKAANGFFLHDMAGNVFEWASDRFRSDYYSQSPSQDPQGPATGDTRVVRGGAFNWYQDEMRASDRDFHSPPFVANETRGFRVARSVTGAFPSIASVSPSSGLAGASFNAITITGSNLGSTHAVFIGGAAGQITAVTPTSVTFSFSGGTVGPKDVVVTTSVATAKAANAFTFYGQPTIQAVSPSGGPLAGGTPITITGTNFFNGSSDATVSIGGVAATVVRVVDSNTITAVTPAVTTAGARSVSVSTTGAQTITVPNAFTYFAAPTVTGVSPSSGSTAGGTTITVTGTNFYNGTSPAVVMVGGVPATSVSVTSPTQLTAVTPPGTAGVKTVSVTTVSGEGQLANAFTYLPAPTIASVAPNAGPLGGGTQIVISGANFTGATAVSVGGVPASFSVTGAGTISATTPAGALGTVSVGVTTPVGTATLSNAFTYLAAPTITGVSPSSGPSTGGTLVTITGTNFSAPVSVSIGGAALNGVVVISPTTVRGTTSPATGGVKDVVLTTQGGSDLLEDGFRFIAQPAWATVIEFAPNPAVVTSAAMRSAIEESGLPWRVRDTATQIEMLLVPAGVFEMGCSPSTQSACQADESPVHEVTLSQPFYIGRYELTQLEWKRVMVSNPSFFQGAAYPGSDNRPVERVSWQMVTAFMNATGFRLPTEAEWEYACRAGTTTAFHGMPSQPNGFDDESLLNGIAWFGWANAGMRTNFVGLKAPNALGLHDMSGNVAEWVSDWWSATYYASSPATDPTGPAAGTGKVLRGGSWRYVAELARSSSRESAAPGFAGDDLGFRVARNVVPTAGAGAPADATPADDTGTTPETDAAEDEPASGT